MSLEKTAEECPRFYISIHVCWRSMKEEQPKKDEKKPVVKKFLMNCHLFLSVLCNLSWCNPQHWKSGFLVPGTSCKKSSLALPGERNMPTGSNQQWPASFDSLCTAPGVVGSMVGSMCRSVHFLCYNDNGEQKPIQNIWRSHITTWTWKWQVLL